MMRIGIIAGEYPPMQGGVGAYTRILAKELVRQGHQVGVFSTQQAQSPDDGIALTNSLTDWGLGSLLAIRRWAQDGQFDIINLQFQTAAYGMSPWVHFIPDVVRSVSVVTTFHDLRFPYLFPKAGVLRDWIVMHLAQTSDGVIVTNQEDQQRLIHLPQTALIPIGSNISEKLPEDFDPTIWRQRAGAIADDFLLAFFGLVNHSKGLDQLVDALKGLRERNVPAKLVMIGDVGSSDPTNAAYAAMLETHINNSGLEAYIKRPGFLEDALEVAAYLVVADTVVLPFLDGASYRRGSLMAAIRYGCAIVTTTPQVSVPAFVDGENMIFVAADNSETLTNALHELYKQPEKRMRLREGASKLALQFEWPEIAQQYVEFFHQIMTARA